MGRQFINERVIIGAALLTASAAAVEGREMTRGTAQFINTWSATGFDLFVGVQIVFGVCFLAYGLTGAPMSRRLFAVCCLTTAFFVIASVAYAFGTPGISKAALPYEAGFLALLLWRATHPTGEV